MKQNIKCNVKDCKHCNCDKNECTLKEIKVCSCDDECHKEGTMCDNYKKSH